MINLKFDYESYFYENHLNHLLKTDYNKLDLYAPEHVFKEDGKDPFSPDCDDLIRLHYIIRKRKVLTTLELGVGWSTIVMADAMKKNYLDYYDEIKNKIRRINPFTLYTVDTEKKYLDITKNNLPQDLKSRVKFFLHLLF